MTKILKIGGIVLGGFIGLLLVVPFFIPKGLYLNWAVSAVESRYPVRLKIEDASLALLPIVSVTLKNVTATTAREKQEPLLKAERLSVGIGWTDLFAKRPALVIGARDAVISDGIHADGDVSTLILEEEGGRPGRLELASRNLTLSSPGKLALKRENVSFQSNFIQGDSKTEIRNGALRVGPQVFSVNGTQAKSGALDLTLASEKLDLDYLKKVVPALKELPPVEDAGLTAHLIQSGAARSKPTISGELKAKKVSLPDQELKNLTSGFVYRDPVLNVENLRADTLDGSIGGRASLNLEGASPSYDFNMVLKNVAMDRLSSVSKLMTGRGDLNLKGRGRGTKTEEWSKNLSGDGDLKVRQIRIPALEIFQKFAASPAWDLLQRVPGLIDTGALNALKDLDTRLNDLASAFQVVNGIVRVPRVNLQFPQAAANLSGGIGLDKSLNFAGNLVLERNLVATFVKNPQLLDALAKSGPLTVPIKIGGTVAHPLVAPDDQVLRGKLQAFLNQQAQQKAGQIVRDAVKTQELPKKEDLPSKQDVKDFLKKF